LARLLRKLRAMRRNCPKRDQLLMRVDAAKTEAGRAFGYVKINLPKAGQAVTRESFTFQIDKAKLQEALRDGHYLLRTNLVAEDPAVLWDRYMQLVQVEAAFKCLKSEQGIRPIHHQLEHRVDAHILVAFLAYCLTATLKHRLQAHAPGLTPRAVLENLAAIQTLDVWLPTTDGRYLVMPRYTEPETDLALLVSAGLKERRYRRFCGRGSWAPIGGDAVCTLHKILKFSLAPPWCRRYHRACANWSSSRGRAFGRARCS
jgi:hypothetical protein